jgi:hypothetical protein
MEVIDRDVEQRCRAAVRLPDRTRRIRYNVATGGDFEELAKAFSLGLEESMRVLELLGLSAELLPGLGQLLQRIRVGLNRLVLQLLSTHGNVIGSPPWSLDAPLGSRRPISRWVESIRTQWASVVRATIVRVRTFHESQLRLHCGEERSA